MDLLPDQSFFGRAFLGGGGIPVQIYRNVFGSDLCPVQICNITVRVTHFQCDGGTPAGEFVHIETVPHIQTAVDTFHLLFNIRGDGSGNGSLSSEPAVGRVADQTHPVIKGTIVAFAGVQFDARAAGGFKENSPQMVDAGLRKIECAQSIAHAARVGIFADKIHIVAGDPQIETVIAHAAEGPLTGFRNQDVAFHDQNEVILVLSGSLSRKRVAGRKVTCGGAVIKIDGLISTDDGIGPVGFPVSSIFDVSLCFADIIDRRIPQFIVRNGETAVAFGLCKADSAFTCSGGRISGSGRNAPVIGGVLTDQVVDILIDAEGDIGILFGIFGSVFTEDGRSVFIHKCQVFTGFAETEIGMKLSAGYGGDSCPVRENDQVAVGAHGRRLGELPACQLVRTICQVTAAQIDVFIAVVEKLDPVTRLTTGVFIGGIGG